MISIILIGLIVSILVFSSLGMGRLIIKGADWRKQILFGGLSILALSELVDLILVPFQVPTSLCFALYAFIFIVGLAGLFSRGKSKISFKQCLFLLVYLAVMAYVHSTKAIGEPTFDSAFYLSHVIEGSSAPVFGSVYYETGLYTGTLSSMYDFQSFYHVYSFFLMAAKWIYKAFHLGAPVVTHLYIWSSTLYFYVLLYCFTETVGQTLEIKHSWILLCVKIFLLGIIGNFYWNNSLAFYGNTYRQLISSVLILTIFEMMKTQNYSFHSFLLLSMVSCAMFSVSSSALFICFVVFFSFICILFYEEFEYRGCKYLLILIPMILFGLIYCRLTYGTVVLPALIIFLFAVFCFMFDFLFSSDVKAVFLNLLKKLMMALPLLLSVISVCLWLQHEFNVFLFFEKYSTMDMVWDYFRLDEPIYILLNCIYCLGIVLLVIQRKKYAFSNYLFYAIASFINPVNIIIVRKFLAYIVFYRSYEAVLNYFTCVLLVVLVLKLFENRKVLCCTFAFVFGIVSFVQAKSYYHHFYQPSEQFNRLYKVDELELDMIQVFSELVSYEEERVSVVSQMDSLKGFVPKVVLAFSMRDVGLYSVNVTENQLLKIFYPRMHAGQIMFDEEPDFKCACDELIEKRVDYVIIDRNQVYLDNGKYEHLYYLVRDCADLEYQNDRYALFRFYW